MKFSVNEIQDFEQGSLWQLMVAEIQEWERRILNELAAPTFNASEGKMDFSASERAMYDEGLRGSLRATGFFKSLPEMMVEALKQEEQQNESGNE